MTRHDITPDLLRMLLNYDQITGALTWKERTTGLSKFRPAFGSPSYCTNWNTRFAGEPAFARISVYGYSCGDVLGVPIFAHRVIWAMVHDYWPNRIDHINGKRDDNRLVNLRDVSATENNRNKCISKANSSGVTGIHWHRRDRSWYAIIYDGGRKRHLGSFATKERAIEARKQAERLLRYHPNHGRQA